MLVDYYKYFDLYIAIIIVFSLSFTYIFVVFEIQASEAVEYVVFYDPLYM